MSLQSQLRRAAAEGFVTEREFNGLYIYTYTPTCVKERVWDQITRMARGIILDKDGKVIARPFDKFFNLFERPETEPKNLPNGPFTVMEKVDGSMGTVFFNPFTNQWDIATKGSYNSEQADFARMELLPLYDLTRADPKCTLITEIVYPDNRIVVNYDDWAGLKLLAIRRNSTGAEEPSGRLPILAGQFGMETPQVYPLYKDILDLPMTENMEGYVVRFQNGLRVKVKNPWYLQIHRALDSKSLKRIIELVEAGEWRAFWEALPKELQKEFDDLYAEIRTAIWDIENRVQEAWSSISNAKMVGIGRCGRYGRKDFAVWVQANIEAELHPIMYSILDGNDWKHHLFSILKKKFV